MKKILCIGAVVSLVFTSQTRAGVLFHYDWVDETEFNTTTDFTEFDDSGLAEFEVCGSILRAVHTAEEFQWQSGFYTQNDVVVAPSPTTSIELFVDVWSITGLVLCGLISDTQAWQDEAPPPGTSRSLPWALGVNIGTPDSENPDFRKIFVNLNGLARPTEFSLNTNGLTVPFRVRVGADATGYTLAVRELEGVGGVATGFVPGSTWDDFPPTDTVPPTPGLVAGEDVPLNTGPAGGMPPNPNAPPWVIGLSKGNGTAEIGMIEVHDTLGNDGSFGNPAAGAVGLVYHRDWVGATELGTEFTTFANGPNVPTYTAESNVLSVTRTDGVDWRYGFHTTEAVALPNAASGAIEVIVDVWENPTFFLIGLIHDTAAWLTPTDPFQAGVSAGPGWTYGLLVGDIGSLFNTNLRDVIVYRNEVSSGQTVGLDYPETLTVPFRLRMSWSGDPREGYNVAVRQLEGTGGLTSGFAAGSDWSATFNEGVNIQACNAPQTIGFGAFNTDAGSYEIGMIEVYDTVGNDGSFTGATGACEISGGAGGTTCEVLTEDDCDAQGGTYQGDGVPCPGGAQLPGNSNQDTSLDLSDVVTVLGFLFQGNPSSLPCTTDAANEAFLDVNTDTAIDLSDAIFLLAFLFQGGPPPDQGEVCIPIVDCPPNPACP